MDSIVQFNNVVRRYGDKVAVDKLQLSLSRGELFALLGHNGAGKTTTIKMVVGLLRPDSGTVIVGGYDVSKHTRQAVSTIGYVPDQPYLYDKLTGREFLRFVAEMYGYTGSESRDLVDREIGRFGLESFVDELTERYSHGMKQRMVFAAAMLHNPQVLVIDEPLVGLDPHSIRLVKDLLRHEVEQGLCVFMSTHTLAAAEEIADRIGVMQGGRMLFLGTVDELRTLHDAAGETLERLYLTLLDRDNQQAAAAVKPADTNSIEATA